MAEHALDLALADLVEAFGHTSEAELQAFLKAMPPEETHPAVPVGDPSLVEWPASVSLAAREPFGVVQAVRA